MQRDHGEGMRWEREVRVDSRELNTWISFIYYVWNALNVRVNPAMQRYHEGGIRREREAAFIYVRSNQCIRFKGVLQILSNRHV